MAEFLGKYQSGNLCAAFKHRRPYKLYWILFQPKGKRFIGQIKVSSFTNVLVLDVVSLLLVSSLETSESPKDMACDPSGGKTLPCIVLLSFPEILKSPLKGVIKVTPKGGNETPF